MPTAWQGELWKLALHLRGIGEEPLLETYQPEREPHVRQVTLAAKELRRIICERDDAAAAARDAELLGELAARPEGIVRWSFIPGLAEGFLAPLGLPARGDLLPQPTVTHVRGKEDLLDTFTGGTFQLVVRHDVDAIGRREAFRCGRSARPRNTHQRGRTSTGRRGRSSTSGCDAGRARPSSPARTTTSSAAPAARTTSRACWTVRTGRCAPGPTTCPILPRGNEV